MAEYGEGLEHEPTSAADAGRLIREMGAPEIIETPDEPAAHLPAPGTNDNFDDVFPDPTQQIPQGEVPAGTKPPAAEPASATPAPPAGTPAPEAAPVDPYAEFGGRQYVQDATVVAQALQTESGVRALVAQGLQALGKSPEEVAAFMQAAQAAPQEAVDPWSDIADDDVVTGAELKQMLGDLGKSITEGITGQLTQAQQQAVLPLQQQIQQDRQRVATAAVDGALAEAIPSLKEWQPGTQLDDVTQGKISDIQAAATRYLDPNDWDPNHIAAAIRRGAADVEARDQARFRAYVADKRATRANQPANIGGGAPGGTEVQEPRNTKEAIAMRKAMGIN